MIGGPPASATAVAPTLTGPAPSAGSASRAGGCPVCGAGRDGRFCEECGYDFELAEAMPETVLTAGVGPAETPVASTPAPSAPAPESQASNAPGPSAAAEPGEPGEAEQGLDLEAELARAEAQAAQEPEPAQSGSEPVPVVPLPDPVAGPVPAAVWSGTELTLTINADREYYEAQVGRGDIIESEFPFPKYPAERRFTFPVGPGPIRIGRASSSRGLAPEIDLTGPPLDPAVSHLHAQLLKHDEGWVVVDLGSANGTRLNDAAEPLEAETEIPVKPGDRIHLGVWTTIVVQ